MGGKWSLVFREVEEKKNPLKKIIKFFRETVVQSHTLAKSIFFIDIKWFGFTFLTIRVYLGFSASDPPIS